MKTSIDKKMILRIALLAFLFWGFSFSAPDPNTHIYIAIGQSNMAGTGKITDEDRVDHPRFKMIATTTCPKLGRPSVGEVYPAIPPLFHCNEGLSIADWFGRSMADSTKNATIIVIPIAVGGASIKLYDTEQYESYLSKAEPWVRTWAFDYEKKGNIFKALIETAKKAQRIGVIKGIIFHQGESDKNLEKWECLVEQIYRKILKELHLTEDNVPLVVGEMLEGGISEIMNAKIYNLQNYISSLKIVSSKGLAGKKDRLHFNRGSYKELGFRYAEKMMEAQGRK